MREALRSFRAISAQECSRARPLTVRLLRADAGTRFRSLALTSPLGQNSEGYLRLINGLYPTGEPSPGALIKVIR